MSQVRKDVRHGYCLIVLVVLFSLRVAGQFIQSISLTDYLPGMSYWQGSNLSYGWLLGSQLLIILVAGVMAYRILHGRLSPRRRMGRVWLLLGTVYFTVMLARLILGLTVLADHAWFAKPIPAFFHLVLAGMVLTIGHYHWRKGA